MMTRVFLAVSLCALTAGCAVGPDFHAPPPPLQKTYTADDGHSMAATPGPAGGVQSLRPGGEVDGAWWHGFASPELDGLIERALAANTDLAATRAGLRQARELWLAQRGILFPTLQAEASSSREKGSQYLAPVPNDSTFTYSLQTAQLNIGYTLDLFGGNRRSVEQVRAAYEAQVYQADAARITLVNTVAATAILHASLRDQVKDQQRIIALQREVLTIMRHQLAMGAISGGDVMAQQAQLAQAQAGLPPLERALAQSHDLLAYLTGRSAADMPELSLRLGDMALPHDLPLALPAELVRRRPDIRAAEANLQAASAGIGVAMANRLPQLTIGAAAGGNAGGWSTLLSAANAFWSAGAGIAQPVFAGGTLLHRQRAARAAFDQADAQYRSTVLSAFQNVADTLAALQSDAAAVSSAHAALDSARALLKVAEGQERAGQASEAGVIQARIACLQAEQALSQAAAARLSDTAALFQAIGGGDESGKS